MDHPNHVPGVPMVFPPWVERLQIKYMNPLMAPVARRLPTFGVIKHRGRTSGKAYRPSSPFRKGNVVAVGRARQDRRGEERAGRRRGRSAAGPSRCAPGPAAGDTGRRRHLGDASDGTIGRPSGRAPRLPVARRCQPSCVVQFRACRLTLSPADQRLSQQMHRDRRRALPDVGAVAGQRYAVRVDRSAVGQRHGEADRADRLVLGAAAGSGDPGDRDRGVGAEPPQRTAAIASATGSDTAPCSSISAGSTPSSSDFASLEYATTPPATYADEPGRSVSRPPAARGARLSGRDSCARSSSSGDLIVDHGSRPRRRSRARAGRAAYRQQVRVGLRVVRFVAGDDLELAAAQAGGDLQPRRNPSMLRSAPGAGCRPDRTPAARTFGRCLGGRRCGPAIASCTRGSATAVLHIGCSSRGGPGSTTTVGVPGMTTPGAVPTGSMTCAPAGTIACLRLAAQDRVEVAVREPSPSSVEDLARSCPRARRRASARGRRTGQRSRRSCRRRSVPGRRW